MAGVEILNTTYEYESLINPGWTVILAMIGIIIAIIGVSTIRYDSLQRVLFILAGFIIIGMCACMVCASIKTDKIVSTKYQVTIDDSVSMNEFLDKYEIIDQEGKIYTVKERE